MTRHWHVHFSRTVGFLAFVAKLLSVPCVSTPNADIPFPALHLCTSAFIQFSLIRNTARFCISPRISKASSALSNLNLYFPGILRAVLTSWCGYTREQPGVTCQILAPTLEFANVCLSFCRCCLVFILVSCLVCLVYILLIQTVLTLLPRKPVEYQIRHNHEHDNSITLL